MTLHPIPAYALDDRLGFLGTSGSGKTYNAGTAVEILLSQKARVVIIDPLGVWWGLRQCADGKTPSNFNVAIFGGPHGDLPLTEYAGALIGETAATMADSCIIDLSELKSKAAERRFMVAFLEAIYRKAGGEPFHLVVDEADLFAPQKPAGGDETLLGHMENIVRRGRIKGFIPWLICQRPAVLNKNVLSQVDGLVAFKLTATQDRDALDAWIEGQADKAKGKEIKDALPTLQIGQGVVWIPGRGILDAPASFPAKITFDSSRTPKRGEKLKHRALKPLDLTKLKDQLAVVEAERKANDPKALKDEIAALKAEKQRLEQQASTAAGKSAGPDKDAIAAAEQRGFEQAQKKLTALAEKDARAKVVAALEELRGVFAPISKALVEALEAAIRGARAYKPDLSSVDFAPSRAAPAPTAARAAPPRPMPPTVTATSGSLPGPEQRIVNSLATWRALGHATPSNAQVAWLANYSPSSTSYTNPRSALKTKGLIEYPSGDRVALTADGATIAVASEIGGRIVDHVLGLLPGPERRILAAAVSHYPNAASNEEVAAGADYSASSTSYTNPRSALRTKELITYPSNGQVRAAEWLFA